MYNVLVIYYCLNCHSNRLTHMARRHPLHSCEISAHSMFCVSSRVYYAPVSAAADCTQHCEDIMCTSPVWVSCLVVLGWDLICARRRRICNATHTHLKASWLFRSIMQSTVFRCSLATSCNLVPYIFHENIIQLSDCNNNICPFLLFILHHCACVRRYSI